MNLKLNIDTESLLINILQSFVLKYTNLLPL